MVLLFKVQINLLSLVLLIKLRSTASFIETQQPIVITEKYGGESHFSYSIAGVSNARAQNFISKIYIGAPKGNYSSSRGNNQNPIEPGFIWECKLMQISESNKVECTILDVISTKNNDDGTCCTFSDAYRTLITKERCYKQQSSGMWMGGTISLANNDEFVSCGYRWQTEDLLSRERHRRVNGICYIVKSTSQGLIKRELKPPLDPTDQFVNYKTRGVSEHLWFYGEFGFSSVVDKQQRLLVGVPGYLHWRGTVTLYSSYDFQNVPCRPLTTFTDSREDVNTGSDYLGYSMCSGNFLNSEETLFAVGAPRGTKGLQELTGYVKLLKVQNNQLISTIDLVGIQLGAYFGSVLASADINGDGLDELIIGSPMNTEETSQSFDEGCIFIWTTSYIKRTLQFRENLCPNKESGGRFGSAISNIGDINYDNLEDIAISAPGAANGAGEVYIYYGSKNLLSLQTPLKISASDISPNLKGFGSTLFGKVDVDGNGTPDLLIGSFISKQVIIFRSRPKVDISVFILSYIANNKEIVKFKREDKEFQIKYCIRTKRSPTTLENLKIWVDVSVDERFQFVQNNQRKIVFSKDVPPDCIHQFLGVKLIKELEPNDNNEIVFHWNLWYNETANLPKDIRVYEITGAATTTTNSQPGSGEFCSFCPAPSQTLLLKSGFPIANDNCDQDGNPECTTDLQIRADIIDQNSSKTDFIIGSEEPRWLNVTITNFGETAYSPKIELIIKGESKGITELIRVELEPSGCVSQQEITLMEENGWKKYSYDCNLPLHLTKSLELKLKIIVDVKFALINDEQIQFVIFTHPKSQNNQLKNSAISMQLKSEFQLQFKEIKQDVMDIQLNSKVVPFKSSYQISNLGISPLDSVKLGFHIPVNTSGAGNIKVISVAVPHPSMEIECSISDPQGFQTINIELNPSQFQTTATNGSGSMTISRRKRRETQNHPDLSQKKKQDVPSVLNNLPKVRNLIEIECGVSKNWICVTVICDVKVPLKNNNPLNVDLRLGLITRTTRQLISEEVKEITIRTNGQANVFGNVEKASSVTQLQIIKDEGQPAWLYFISVIGGLILFLFLVFFLFKCGFFRRKTREDLQSLKAKAEQEDLLKKNFEVPTDEDD